MISEPELVDGGDFPPPAPAAPPPPRAGRPGPWRSGAWRSGAWALGGALVASALWAGGLSAYHAAGPSLGGYRTVEDLCGAAKLTALGAAYGKRAEDPDDRHSGHEALDQASCSVTFLREGDDGQDHGAGLTYELHKRTDPGPEFEPSVTGAAYDSWDWKPLEGLGERAFFAQDDEGYAALRVLDGQAVLGMTFSVQVEYDPEQEGPPPAPALSAAAGVKDLMVKDMKALMAALKG
ncbi:hypothetical protein [Streptomyces sp. NPDC015131]|uniref:hypothetical protein n=1 Tax=Streptomyces sp. NPDC015131 TaxID=3364941 RepID=UPI0036F5E45D